MKRFGFLALVLSCGCNSGPSVRALVGVALPVTAGDLEHIGVTVEQGGAFVTPTATDDPLVLRFELEAGVETTISAILVDARIGGIDAFTGAVTLTPTPGEQGVPVTTEAAPAVPLVADLGFSSGETLFGSVPLIVSLHVPTPEGEVVVLGTDPMVSGVAYDLPAGYDVTLEGATPDATPLVHTFTVDAAQPSELLDVGPLPAPPSGLPLSDGRGVAVGGPTGIAGAFGYTLECAAGACGAAPVFEPCDSLILPPPLAGLEGPSASVLAVQYREVEGSCTTLPVDFDFTAPDLSVTFEPPVLSPGLPRTLVAHVHGTEVLDPGTFHVRLAGSSTDLCIPTAAAPSTDQDCNLDLAASTGDQWLRFDIEAKDLGGTLGQIQAYLLDLSQATPADVRITAFAPVPAAVDPNDSPLWFRVVVTNFMPAAQCVQLGGAAVVQPPTSSWSVAVDLRPEDIPAGASRERWLSLSGSFGVPQLGAFTLEATLQDCAGLELSRQTFDLELRDAPIRWLTNEPLVLGGLHSFDLPGTGGFPLTLGEYSFEPLVRGGLGGSDPKSGGSLTFSTSPTPAPFDVVNAGGYSVIRVNGTGDAFLTIQSAGPPVSSDAVPVTMAPAGEIVVLQQDGTVTRYDASDAVRNVATALPTPADIGAGARRLLWESARDRLLTVGTNVVDLDARSAGGFLAGTVCGLNLGVNNIVDAAFTAAAPHHSRALPDLVLLIDGPTSLRHCEVDPETGAELWYADLDSVGTGTWTLLAQAERCRGRLVTNPASGDFGLVGLTTSQQLCAMTYQTRGGVLAPIGALETPWSGTGPSPNSVLDVAYDPFQNFGVVLLQASGGNQVTGVSLGDQLRFRQLPLAAAAGGGFYNAVAVDLQDSVPVLASACPPPCPVPSGSLEWVPGRFTDLLTPRVGTRLANSALPTALAVDSAHGLAVVADEVGLVSLAAARDPSSTFFDGGGVVYQLPGVGPPKDVLITAPQPLYFSPASAAPGDVVTLTGLDFAPGQTEAFVGGIPAEVIVAEGTRLLFRVPPALATLPDPRGLKITVRAHGVVSGAAQGWLEVRPPPPVIHVSSSLGAYDVTCPVGPCAVAQPLIATAYEVLYVSDVGLRFVSAFGLPPVDLDPSLPPMMMATAVHGRRPVGLAGASWFDTRFTPNLQVVAEAAKPALPQDARLRSGVVVAADRAGRSLLVCNPPELMLVDAFAGSVQASGAMAFPAEPTSFALVPDHLDAAGLLPTGDAVVVTSTLDGRLAAQRPAAGGFVDVSIAVASGTCGSGPRALSLISGEGVQRRGTLVLHDAAGGVVEVWELACNQFDGCTKTCRDQLPVVHSDAQPPLAAVSPRGDLVAIVTTPTVDLQPRLDVIAAGQAGPPIYTTALSDTGGIRGLIFSPEGTSLHALGGIYGETLSISDGPELIVR